MKYPPFCPNSSCRHYHSPGNDWYVKSGSYPTKKLGRVQRFQCKTCGTRFSLETFSIDYHTHKYVPYRTIFEHLRTSSGIRDLSRILKVSCGTITDRISRLARQSMAISAKLTQGLRINEDLVADGFESFVCSQYMPNNINILAGKSSQFLFMADYSQLTRKGRMTPKQKKKNKEIRKRISIDRITIYESFSNITRRALNLHSLSAQAVTALYTDEHKQYEAVMNTLSFKERLGLKHIQISSRLARTIRNNLFSVNYLDREFRKDISDHVRETVQFARNANNMMERLTVYALYHNFIKPYRINGNENRGETHATMAGISGRQIGIELKTLFTQRRFLGRHWMLDEQERKLWFHCLKTPLSRHADHFPGYIMV